MVARANNLAQDRPDIQFPTKEVCKCMSKPTRRCWVKLKRIARYLFEHPRAITKFKKGGNLDVTKVYTDSDWAGCPKTRKSTSGCIVVLGGVVKSWSSTQPSMALSRVQCAGESCRGGNRTPIHPQRLGVRDIGGNVHRLVCGKINCKPDRGRKGEAHPHEVPLDSGSGSRRQNQVDEDLWRPESSGRSEQVDVGV